MEWLHEGAILAGFLHLASSSQDQIDMLLEKKITALAYEQIKYMHGGLAVLRPFSMICGAMVAQFAARFLQTNRGGKGILLSGVPGVPPAEVVILGAGEVGTSAARSMLGAGAHVTVLDNNMAALEKILERFPNVVTMFATNRNIERAIKYADVVVGAEHPTTHKSDSKLAGSATRRGTGGANRDFVRFGIASCLEPGRAERA